MAAQPKPSQPGRNDPRISVNGLAEYLTASTLRRHSILREQKKPQPYQVGYYREVERAIAEALSQNDEAPLHRCRMVIGNVQGSDYEQGRRLNGLAALDSFERNLDDTPVEGLERRLGPARPRRLVVEGVPISVRPEVLLRGPGRVGAIKLYLSSTKALGEDRARFGGTILWRYVAEMAREDEEADHEMCFLLDVMECKWHRAPRTYKRRLNHVEAACREIRALWPFL